MKKKSLFIINPISGIKQKLNLPEIIGNSIDKSIFSFEILYTERAGHATEIAIREHQNYDIFVAVGGDGTINEVIEGLKGTNKPLAIIPMGSGNGLARHLGISLKPKDAIKQLGQLIPVEIDIVINQKKQSICTTGVGFDAHIGQLFDKHHKRGFFSYIQLTLKALKKYQPHQYKVRADGFEFSGKAFSVTIANASQFGNNAKICPQASLTDGRADLVIIKPFPYLYFWVLGYKLFFGNVLKSKYVIHHQCKEVEISNESQSKFPIHYDGEPFEAQGTQNYHILQNQLILFVPQKRKI